MAIDNESLEMVELLLENKVKDIVVVVTDNFCVKTAIKYSIVNGT